MDILNRENNLTLELLARIFGNFGSLFGNNFGKCGVTHSDNLTDKPIRIEWEDGTESYPVWAAQIVDEIEITVLLVNIGTADELELISILKSTNSEPIGFLLTTNFDDVVSGAFVSFYNNKPAGTNMLQKLNITSAVELLTQEGKVWQKCTNKTVFDDLYNLLTKLVDSN